MKDFLRRFTFSLWYYFKPPWDSGLSPPELLEFLENRPPGRAIDLGCGTGTNVLTLAEAGWQVTGVDFAPRAIRIARRKLRRARVLAEVQVGDVTDLKGISGPFDFALDLGCFHGLGDKKGAYLSELNRILAPGGHWMMYGFFRSSSDRVGPGLVEADLGFVPASLALIRRQDGTDRRERHSAYFLYQKSS